MELITAKRSRIPAADEGDLYRRLSKPQRNDQPSSPLPFPRSGKVKGAVGKDALNEIRVPGSPHKQSSRKPPAQDLSSLMFRDFPSPWPALLST